MYILADSGATKTDWILFGKQGVVDQFQTTGMNSMVLTETQMRRGPVAELVSHLQGRQAEKCFFYGAGLRTPAKVGLIDKLLGEVLPGAHLEVKHDLLGAARAACQYEAGIVCILGTGSNSCAYDGERLTAEYGGHGYLFGDEGSGADLGRSLIRAALDRKLPGGLIAEIEEFAAQPLLEIRSAAYQHPRPNNFFAEFSPFVHSHLHHPSIDQLVRTRFDLFFQNTVLRYEHAQTQPVHFIGSIARFYQAQLVAVCADHGLKVGRTIKAPAEALVDYHLLQKSLP